MKSSVKFVRRGGRVGAPKIRLRHQNLIQRVAPVRKKQSETLRFKSVIPPASEPHKTDGSIENRDVPYGTGEFGRAK
jgi:hypothetical protein